MTNNFNRKQSKRQFIQHIPDISNIIYYDISGVPRSYDISCIPRSYDISCIPRSYDISCIPRSYDISCIPPLHYYDISTITHKYKK